MPLDRGVLGYILDVSPADLRSRLQAADGSEFVFEDHDWPLTEPDDDRVDSSESWRCVQECNMSRQLIPQEIPLIDYHWSRRVCMGRQRLIVVTLSQVVRTNKNGMTQN